MRGKINGLGTGSAFKKFDKKDLYFLSITKVQNQSRYEKSKIAEVLMTLMNSLTSLARFCSLL